MSYATRRPKVVLPAAGVAEARKLPPPCAATASSASRCQARSGRADGHGGRLRTPAGDVARPVTGSRKVGPRSVGRRLHQAENRPFAGLPLGASLPGRAPLLAHVTVARSVPAASGCWRVGPTVKPQAESLVLLLSPRAVEVRRDEGEDRAGDGPQRLREAGRVVRWHPGRRQQVSGDERAGKRRQERSDDPTVETIRHEDARMPDRDAHHHPDEHAHAAVSGSFRSQSTARAGKTSTGQGANPRSSLETLPTTAA